MATIKSMLNVLIYPAESVPGQWIAHCLELDIVSQGNTAPHALDMIAEAIEMCAEENVKAGRPPFTYRSAPLEVWAMARGSDEAAIRPLRIPKSIPDDAKITPLIRRAL